jgi:hypothetical protein
MIVTLSTKSLNTRAAHIPAKLPPITRALVAVMDQYLDNVYKSGVRWSSSACRPPMTGSHLDWLDGGNSLCVARKALYSRTRPSSRQPTSELGH